MPLWPWPVESRIIPPSRWNLATLEVITWNCPCFKDFTRSLTIMTNQPVRFLARFHDQRGEKNLKHLCCCQRDGRTSPDKERKSTKMCHLTHWQHCFFHLLSFVNLMVWGWQRLWFELGSSNNLVIPLLKIIKVSWWHCVFSGDGCLWLTVVVEVYDGCVVLGILFVIGYHTAWERPSWNTVNLGVLWNCSWCTRCTRSHGNVPWH